VIETSAPVRICDLGGWTDTWFGGPGRVVNFAVEPRVHVRVHAGSAGNRRDTSRDEPQIRTPLVQAALDTYPVDGQPRVDISSDVPPGSGAGTSAAVAVALIGALTMARNEPMTPLDVARAAHRLEVEILGHESGVQDQLAAALGGISYIKIHEYPHARVEALPAWPELDGRLRLVYLGRAHNSSEVHKQVIQNPDRGALDRLRAAADLGRRAVIDQDLAALGQAMRDNTEAQRQLHPALVSVEASRLIDLARSHGALGWKVNGAGGEGGSLTILEDLEDEPGREYPGSIPVRISSGLSYRPVL
jgi:D-glycero-alpha-D-manno-heptose-7-phosphate kinase